MVGAEPETSKAEGATRSALKKSHAGSFVSSFYFVDAVSVWCQNRKVIFVILVIFVFCNFCIFRKNAHVVRIGNAHFGIIANRQFRRRRLPSGVQIESYLQPHLGLETHTQHSMMRDATSHTNQTPTRNIDRLYVVSLCVRLCPLCVCVR